MIAANTIGQISLNISFVLYLVIYLPQIWHNRDPENLKQLSFGLHYIIVTSYSLDLAYSLLKPLPWQYQTVSIVALSLLAIQHLQLIRLALARHNRYLLAGLVGSIVLAVAAIYSYGKYHAFLTLPTITLTIGYLSRTGFLIYMLPQIMRNFKHKSADALSTTFLNLSLFLTTLDLISAWCLQWGWPNQVGTPITLLLTVILRLQQRFYAKTSYNDAGGATATVSPSTG